MFTRNDNGQNVATSLEAIPISDTHIIIMHISTLIQSAVTLHIRLCKLCTYRELNLGGPQTLPRLHHAVVQALHYKTMGSSFLSHFLPVKVTAVISEKS